MADADNFENERLLNAAENLRKSSTSSNPWNPLSPWAIGSETRTVSGEPVAEGNISNTSLKKIKKVAQQLVMNSPDKQHCLIKTHIRASAPPYDSPDSCPPPPNNTPDSGPFNNTSNRGYTSSARTPYSTVKVLKPPEKSAKWTVTPVNIPNNSPIGMHGLAPPGSSSRWTATPVSMMSSPGSDLDSTPSSTPGIYPQNTTGSLPGSAPTREPSNRVYTPNTTSASTPGRKLSLTSPVPKIVVTPPVEEYSPSSSFTMSTPDTPFFTGLSTSDIPRLRSDSEGSVSSILSLNSAMLKLIDTSQESMSSSLQGLKGTDVQSDSSSELESPMSMSSKSSSVSSKSSFNCSPKDDLSKKKQKDLRKKLLQDLMSAEVTRKEEELLKKHNIKLMNLNSPKHNLSEGRFQHEAYPVHTTCGSTPVMLLILIICLALGSFVVTWLFTDLLGPLQRRILVGDYDSLDAANEPYRLPWIPENEEIGSSYKYKGVIDVIPKITSDNIRSQDDPMSTVHDKGYKYQGVRDAVTKITSDNIRSQDDPMSTSHDIGYKYQGVRDVMTKITYDNIRSQDDPTSTVHDKGEKEPSVDDFHNFEEADFGVLKPSVDFNDLHRLEETNNNLETMLNDGGYNDEYQLAIEEGIENESNVMSESSDSDDLDDGIESEKEVGIEHLKPTVLKLLYYNVLKSHKKGDISMQNYTNMYRYLNSFLTTFGSFAATQSKMLNDRIHTLENFKEHNINYTFATTMFKYEIESGLIDDPFPISGSMIFTCLHRHLQYLQEALENIIKLRPKGSLSVAFKAAYDDILADYHHWFVEKFYLLGLSTLPTKEDALHRLNERFVEVSSMSQLAHGLKLVTGVLKELTQVTEVLLNKYNVTQMIPAQVIT